jgi:hypothetical protein
MKQEWAKMFGMTVQVEKIANLCAKMRDAPYCKVQTRQGDFSIFLVDMPWLDLTDTGLTPSDFLSEEEKELFGYVPSMPHIVPLTDASKL